MKKSKTDLAGITLNGETLENYFEKKDSDEINFFKDNIINEINNIRYKKPIHVPQRIDRRKENRNSKTKIYEKEEILRMNIEKNLPYIIKNNTSLMVRVIAILQIEKEHTTQTIINDLKEFGGVDARQNSVSACLATIMKGPLSIFIMRSHGKFPYKYTPKYPYSKIEHKTLCRIYNKRDPYTFSDLCKDRPELKEEIEMLKKPIKINRPDKTFLKEKDIVPTEEIVKAETEKIEIEKPEPVRTPERMVHDFNFNFNINIRFGK